MNQQELQIQLSTQLPNVLCCMIADYSKFKSISLPKLDHERPSWRDLLSYLRKFPDETIHVHFTKMDKTANIALDIQYVYYFYSADRDWYHCTQRDTEVVVKLQNELYAYLRGETTFLYSRLPGRVEKVERLDVYMYMTIEELLYYNRDLNERVWRVQ